jgi:hypothetical protein
LEQADFLIAPFLVLAGAPLPRQRSLTLPDESDEILGQAVRHLDGVDDAPHGVVVTAQVLDLAGQIVLDGAGHAGVEKLGRGGAIEESVEIGGTVEDLEVAVGRGPPER